MTPAEQYAAVVEALLSSDADVTVGSSGKRGFGASALKVHGKIFAMLDSKGEFVVKLPRQRVDALIALGEGERFDPRHGRLMKEWVTIASLSVDSWLAFAREARAYVAAKR